MSDLTERLRDKFRYGYPSWHQPCNEAMVEAADRIEELEAALREIVDAERLSDIDYDIAVVMGSIARRALEGDDE